MYADLNINLVHIAVIITFIVLNNQNLHFLLQIILFYPKLAGEHVQGKTKVHVFDTNFYTKIEGGNYASVKTWTKKVPPILFLLSCNAKSVPVYLKLMSASFIIRWTSSTAMSSSFQSILVCTGAFVRLSRRRVTSLIMTPCVVEMINVSR